MVIVKKIVSVINVVNFIYHNVQAKTGKYNLIVYYLSFPGLSVFVVNEPSEL